MGACERSWPIDEWAQASGRVLARNRGWFVTEVDRTNYVGTINRIAIYYVGVNSDMEENCFFQFLCTVGREKRIERLNVGRAPLPFAGEQSVGLAA